MTFTDQYTLGIKGSQPMEKQMLWLEEKFAIDEPPSAKSHRSWLAAAAAAIVIGAASACAPAAQSEPASLTQAATPAVHYRDVTINGVRIAYREAGDPANPTIVLLHGFPTSSQMFRNHSGTGQILPRSRAGLSWLRRERYAGARDVRVQFCKFRRHYRRLPVREERAVLRCT